MEHRLEYYTMEGPLFVKYKGYTPFGLKRKL